MATEVTPNLLTAANALTSATTIVTVSGASAPIAGQVLTAISSTAASWSTTTGGGAVTINETVQDFVAGTGFTAGTSTTITLGSAPTSASVLQISFDGVEQFHNTWSLLGSTVTFTSPIPFGVQNIEAVWITGLSAPFGGTAAAPGISTTLSGSTGLFSTSANTLGLSTNGTTALSIDAGQIVTISTQLIAHGTTTNDNAAAGMIGEFITSTVTSSSPVSLTSGTGVNITSISLTAGDWDVFGIVGYIPAGGTSTGAVYQSSSITSATIGGEDTATYCSVNVGAGAQAGRWAIGTKRYSLASTTTLYLVAVPSFAGGTMTGFGTISGRRMR